MLARSLRRLIAVALVALGVSPLVGAQRLRVRLGPATTSSSPSLIQLSDLQFQGYNAVPSSGPGDSTGGSAAYGGNVLAIRYVGGQRRYLIPHYTQYSNGRTFGDLVEYQDAASLSTSSDPTTAPQLIETRRWHGAAWTIYDSTPSWANGTNAANGAKLGYIYWDDTRGVIWYTIYGYYSGTGQPILAATQLLDTCSGGYCDVGLSYGPWWYRSSNPTDLYWKQLNMFGNPIPASAQAGLGGNKIILGSGIAAQHITGNWGPGLTAFADWPPLTDPPNTVIALGTQLANYSVEESPITPVPNTHRPTDYAVLSYADHYLESTFASPVGATGFWNGSLDRMAGYAWVETATKRGIVLFSVRGTGRATYGNNPISTTPMAVTTLTRSGTTATIVVTQDHASLVPVTTGDNITISLADITTSASFTGSITGSVLTVTSVTSGTISVGHIVVGDYRTGTDTFVNSFGTGSGGTGTYNLSRTFDGIPSTAMRTGVKGWNQTWGPITQTGAGTFTFTVDTSLATTATRLMSDTPVQWSGWDTAVIPDLVDPTGAYPEGQHGYRSESFAGSVFVFDPAELAQVVAGTRNKFSDIYGGLPGINPHFLGDWHTQWPNLPVLQGLAPGATATRLIADNLGQRVVWDSIAQQLLWIQPSAVNSSGTIPTVTRFTIAP